MQRQEPVMRQTGYIVFAVRERHATLHADVAHRPSRTWVLRSGGHKPTVWVAGLANDIASAMSPTGMTFTTLSDEEFDILEFAGAKAGGCRAVGYGTTVPRRVKNVLRV
jgi:hypothetical protein